VKGNSLQALIACYESHHRRLYLIALAITKDRATAEDAVHDALEKLLRVSRRPDDMLAYAMRAVRNAAIDLARRQRRCLQQASREELFEPHGSEPCEVSTRALMIAFDELSDDEREAVWLHIYGELSFRQIAELRGRSLNTVTSWYRRGISRLQATLGVTNG
jgi:RNA polymerase sigma factor (sigma-70 family)